MKKIITLIFLISLFACKEKKPQVFYFDNASSVIITGAKGTKIKLRPGVFDAPEGVKVKLTLDENYLVSEMLANNLHSTFRGKPMTSFGMINLQASAEGKNIKLKDGEYLEIKSALKGEMSAFEGVIRDGELIWMEPNEPVATVLRPEPEESGNIPALETASEAGGDSEESAMFSCSNCYLKFYTLGWMNFDMIMKEYPDFVSIKIPFKSDPVRSYYVVYPDEKRIISGMRDKDSYKLFVPRSRDLIFVTFYSDSENGSYFYQNININEDTVITPVYKTVPLQKMFKILNKKFNF